MREAVNGMGVGSVIRTILTQLALLPERKQTIFGFIGVTGVKLVTAGGVVRRSVIHAGPSDGEDDFTEGAALDQMAECIGRFIQRKGLGHHRFEPAGFEQRDNGVPSISKACLRLSKQ